jgi:hypothetical protein
LLQCSALTKDGNYTIIDNFANEWNSVPFTFTLTQDGYLYFTIRKDADTNINPSDYRAKILGHTYTIPFTDSQGNPIEVYGGTLDVVSGVLTVDRGILTLNGSEDYYSIQSSIVDGNTVLRVATGQACKQNEKQKSNYGTFDNYAWQPLESRANTFVLGSEGNLYLQLPSNTASTVEEFKALFASNNFQIVYELVTPTTIQLTPTQVKSLLGSNNVWADCGDVIEANYIRCLDITINDLISRVEALEG